MTSDLHQMNLDQILTLISSAKSTMDTKNTSIKGDITTVLGYINKQENITAEQKEFITQILGRAITTLGN